MALVWGASSVFGGFSERLGKVYKCGLTCCKILEIKAILVYARGHLDHIFGSTVFMENSTEVISTQDAVDFMKRNFVEMAGLTNRSRHIQFGDICEEYARKRPVKSPVRLPSVLSKKGFIWPTITFDQRHSFELGGKRFEFFHTTGETPGHLMVWLPDEKAFFCGDLYYFSFPNLSTPMLRPRPVKGWYDGYGTGLNPLPPHFRAREPANLAGGADKILKRAISLQKSGEHQLRCLCLATGKQKSS